MTTVVIVLVVTAVVGIGVLAGMVAAIRALRRADQQINRIFDEELDDRDGEL